MYSKVVAIPNTGSFKMGRYIVSAGGSNTIALENSLSGNDGRLK